MPAVATDVPLRETPASVMDAPFEHNDDTTMMTVTKNILLAHGRAVQVLRKNCPDAKVGIAPTGDCCLPKDGSPEEVEKAQAKSLSHYPGYIMSNTWWADPVFWGRYPEWAREKFGDIIPPCSALSRIPAGGIEM